MRQMVFVDGSNLLRQLATECGVNIRADKPPDAALRKAAAIASKMASEGVPKRSWLIRSYWFGSYQGNEEDERHYASVLRECGFEPVLFRQREGREKGVDIALTKEMLVNAFNQNYDLAVVIAGDEDYVGLVSEAKRHGPIINGAFVNSGLSEALRLACDSFRVARYSPEHFLKQQMDEFKLLLEAKT